MAKDNNLQDLLTDIADAIREKKGTTEKINAQNFSAEIASIETGGGAVVAAPLNDVNFRDYDGTILHSYTKDEFLALSALPNLPTREGLICQEWNWDFADAQEYVAEYGRLEVGATYITDDGKTRLYIRIAEIGRMDVPLYFSQTVANGVTIDWGDGSATETLDGTGNVNTTHTYADKGDYIITLDVADGCDLGLGHGSMSYCVMGSIGNNGRVYCNMLQKAELGNGVTSIREYAFYYCNTLASIVIPQGITRINASVFRFCSSLASVVIPQGITRTYDNLFYSCYTLGSVVIPKSVTRFNTGSFYSCYSLASVVIPESVTRISDNSFNFCFSLASVVIPESVTNIDSYAFQNCHGMALYDFRASTAVPTLASTNAFQSIPSDCKIVVPNKLYSEWIAATNWSTYASQIFKASDVFPSDEPEDEGVIEYHFEIELEDTGHLGAVEGYTEGDFSELFDKLKSLIETKGVRDDYSIYMGETEGFSEYVNITFNGKKAEGMSIDNGYPEYIYFGGMDAYVTKTKAWLQEYV